MKELDVEYKNIAYAGANINDIEILLTVKFCTCSADAIEECGKVVDYVCERKGSDGYIREFVELIVNNNYQKQNIIQEIKKEVK